jgi:hypothetical protein
LTRKIAKSLPIACLLILLSVSDFQAAARKITGMYSNHAAPVFDLHFSRSSKAVRVLSPDRQNVVVVKFQPDSTTMLLSLEIGAKSHRWEKRVSIGTEVRWSADSKAFFLTESTRGRNGPYKTTLYLLDDDGVRILDVTPIVYEAFGHPVKCSWSEAPNVAGIKWLEGSRRILVAAEIVNHSVCDSFGTFRLYEISVPALEVIREYGQIKAKRLYWDELGWELRPANDNCISHPESCEVSSNHSP